MKLVGEGYISGEHPSVLHAGTCVRIEIEGVAVSPGVAEAISMWFGFSQIEWSLTDMSSSKPRDLSY